MDDEILHTYFGCRALDPTNGTCGCIEPCLPSVDKEDDLEWPVYDEAKGG